VTNCTFTGNNGDAIFSSTPKGTTSLIVTASTFTANHAGRDGGTIRAYTGLVSVAADVFTGWCDHARATWIDAGYNVGSNASCFAASPSGTDVDAGSTAALKLGPLTHNGGPTRTIAPQPGRPVNGIIPDPTTVTVGGGSVVLCPATDQRGYASAPGPCDAGSVQATGTRG
jgi:hypothetical protein